MVLRWSGRDGGSPLVSLSEAVTAVRVRVECALLTEAFTYQRMLCTKVREKKLKFGTIGETSDDLKDGFKTWEQWVEILVTEICCLCIRRNLVDRMIELPWNSDEEKYLHKCLLDSATDDPSTTIGSLLVVFYIQVTSFSPINYLYVMNYVFWLFTIMSLVDIDPCHPSHVYMCYKVMSGVCSTHFDLDE